MLKDTVSECFMSIHYIVEKEHVGCLANIFISTQSSVKLYFIHRSNTSNSIKHKSVVDGYILMS